MTGYLKVAEDGALTVPAIPRLGELTISTYGQAARFIDEPDLFGA